MSVYFSERGGGVEGSRGGGASEAGEREALSERGAGTSGEEEGERLRIVLDNVWNKPDIKLTVACVCACVCVQRLEEIMKRTRKSDTGDKVSSKISH